MNENNTKSTDKKNIRELVEKTLARRRAQEIRFQRVGIGAIFLGVLFVSFLFINIISNGYGAFKQAYIKLDVFFDPQVIDPQGEREMEVLSQADYSSLWKQSVRELFPTLTSRNEKRQLYDLISPGATFKLREMVMKNPDLIGSKQTLWVPANDDIDMWVKGYVSETVFYNAQGTASPTAVNGEIKVLSTSNDFFSAILGQVKQHLQARARNLESKTKKLQQNLQDQVDDLAALREEVVQAKLKNKPQGTLQYLETAITQGEARQARLLNEINTNKETIANWLQRANTPGGEEKILDDMPSYLVMINDGVVKINSISLSGMEGQVLKSLTSTQDAPQGTWKIMELSTPQAERRQQDATVVRVWELEQQQRIRKQFNITFFTAGDSREPELAGIWGAAVGSFYTLLITLCLSFPIGVSAAIYLEEFAPKNKWTDLIEVNINNLAAVPSIVFGLLGLAVFINFFGLPRSAPLVGGLVLTLMTLPTIIIASRAALKSVPPSIREAALGVGASKMQTTFHHVLPLALPGMLTGTIIGMAQALGESAPLLMIGMVAFIVDIPGGFTDPATVLPVQIYLWADSPERAFVERTSAAIMVLLGFLIVMNALAVMLRRKFERRW